MIKPKTGGDMIFSPPPHVRIIPWYQFYIIIHEKMAGNIIVKLLAAEKPEKRGQYLPNNSWS